MDNPKDSIKLPYDEDVIVKDCMEVFEDIEFENENERLRCIDIITNIERFAAENIKKKRIVNIPYIGRIMESPEKVAINEHRNELKEFRKDHTSEEYKEFASKIINEKRAEEKKKDEVKLNFISFRSKNKKLYDRISVDNGVTAGLEALAAIKRLKPVEFDEEVNEVLMAAYSDEK